MRADLRLADLESGIERVPTKLMNVKLPNSLWDAIDDVAEELGCTKTAAVVALLNEGLDAFGERRHEFPSFAAKRPRRGRPAKPLKRPA
jgi:hypothetical protein